MQLGLTERLRFSESLNRIRQIDGRNRYPKARTNPMTMTANQTEMLNILQEQVDSAEQSMTEASNAYAYSLQVVIELVQPNTAEDVQQVWALANAASKLQGEQISFYRAVESRDIFRASTIHPSEDGYYTV